MIANNNDFEKALKLINDNSNVSKTNIFNDLFEIILKLVLFFILLYFFIFFFTGCIISVLDVENQVKLENFLSSCIKIKYEMNKTQNTRLLKLKDTILKCDKDFPKTSNLEIRIVQSKTKNALCYPNGNIYITSSLYEVSDDEMLTFIIAHEMAHYKNKDHLTSLRKNIAGASTIIVASIFSPEQNTLAKFVANSVDLGNCKHSRISEKNADIYAGKILLDIYGDISGGLRVFDALSTESTENIEILSSHPDITKRKKILSNIHTN